jgi:hypothetical protein
MLVWAMVIGYLAWGDVPTLGLLVGSGIVVASGLFLLWHEAQGQRAERQAAAAAATAGELQAEGTLAGQRAPLRS